MKADGKQDCSLKKSIEKKSFEKESQTGSNLWLSQLARGTGDVSEG